MENVSYYKSFLPKGLKKLFTIMRITVILLFVALFQMVAVESSYSQSATISVKAEQISLTDLFSQIEHQSEFLFFYVDEEVKNIALSTVFHYPVMLTSRRQYALRYLQNYDLSNKFNIRVKINKWNVKKAKEYIDNFCQIKGKDQRFTNSLHEMLTNI